MYRQGDVLIMDPVRLPANATRRKNNVVAEGEATGHAHRLVGGDVFDLEGGGIAIAVAGGGALTHEEHHRVELDANEDGMAYPVIIQREYDDEQEWRQVAD